jgi:predicted NAD/FAD-dependent oxidoreductase
MNLRETRPEHTDVLVIGAGMAGLRAAELLSAAGRQVIVLDKGRRHGGRMATRRVDDASFDTGAIAFTATSGAFRSTVAEWEVNGHVRSSNHRGRAHWRGSPLMRSLPAALAATIDERAAVPAVRLATQVTGLAREQDFWRADALHEGSSRTITADALVLTAPAPQALALLDVGSSLVSAHTLARLEGVAYAPTLTVLARPRVSTSMTGDPDVHAVFGPGTAAPDLARLHHNDRSGASLVPALTLQATPTFSAAHLDEDRDAAAAVLVAQASAIVGVPLEVVHVHGWRFAQVVRGIDTDDGAPALRDDTSGAPLVLAGDLFAPPAPDPLAGTVTTSPTGVERAFLSGTKASELLI